MVTSNDYKLKVNNVEKMGTNISGVKKQSSGDIMPKHENSTNTNKGKK